MLKKIFFSLFVLIISLSIQVKSQELSAEERQRLPEVLSRTAYLFKDYYEYGVQMQMGKTYFDECCYKEAIKYFKKALKIIPNSAEAKYYLSYCKKHPTNRKINSSSMTR